MLFILLHEKRGGSLSKLPVAESPQTCLAAEGWGWGVGEALRPSALVGQNQPALRVQLALSCISLVLSFLIRQTQFRVEALLIGHPSKTHAESKLPAIDWLSLSCATHHFQHKAQAAWHKL